MQTHSRAHRRIATPRQHSITIRLEGVDDPHDLLKQVQRIHAGTKEVPPAFDETLFRALAAKLAARGIAQPNLWAVLVLQSGIENAVAHMSEVFANALCEARDELRLAHPDRYPTAQAITHNRTHPRVALAMAEERQLVERAGKRLRPPPNGRCRAKAARQLVAA